MANRISARHWFLATALAYIGTPYIWGGDDPSGFDCSGFVVECLKSCGLLSENDDYTADSLWRLFRSRRVDLPRRGALLFRVNRAGVATHMAICLDEQFQISAGGGNNRTTDHASAWRDNAYIRIRPIRFDLSTMRLADPFSG